MTTMQESKTLQQYIEENGLSMTAELVESNPNMDADAWAADASHWAVKITSSKTGETMETFFSQGSAHTEAPTLEDVLDCLASDAAGVEATFDEWCGEYGYDTDSRKALATYETIQKQAGDLSRLVGWWPKGSDAYSDLLYNVERL